MTVPDPLLRALGGTTSDPRALDLLVTHQRRLRLLTLRALLDTVAEAPPGALPPAAAARVTADWRLLAAADRADPAAARQVVHYPLTGAWAERALRAVTAADRPREATAELSHLAAIAAAAAARAGLRFTADVPVRAGLLTLPTLGGCAVSGDLRSVRVSGDGPRLWLHLDVAGDGGAARHLHSSPAAGRGRRVEVRRGPDAVWRSAAAAWQPTRALRWAGGRPVLVDDSDPYRDEERGSNPRGLTASHVLEPGRYARWQTAWQDAQPWLRLGGGGRAREVGALLGCFVPLDGSESARCSATRGEAFGALLSSTPQHGLDLAATLVHELQHTKLLALSAMTVLHTADGTPRYWAPWRPDPRPFDGLFHGAYAHLALADFHLGVAMSGAATAVRDAAWADHCRCRQQVEVALPQLLGSSRLTVQGRTLVTAMAAHHRRLKEHTPPEGHLARATAYVETARVIWRRQGV
ncbi:HEXXH motif-containing putative peptide modification protein [Streptomyces cocklensis]|uniref:HEXXH motif-containing protein n=1 Tax=Actinacidiphila cocklensis TaxID=887465 RepID=A0A9W4DUN9_9ACTN|nr:HEXXH motif-containing putative peptide modification protein [Actinacidiphila cocklensis]MDD1061285.1 HEXXH motif-containing putative peptide modification protein [Actinacidiphila cocklensis]CAG6395847.1 HEXXH motif-containing protein [Actinacidiphila cocklensis]